MRTLSQRAQQLESSATLGMAQKASIMVAEGIDVIGFSTGEPDFDTPEYIKDAAKAALDRGFTKYAPAAGYPALRDAISQKMERENDLAYSRDEITVTCGAKQAIANALLTLIDDGDEVIIPAPYWVSYPSQVRLAGGTPVIIDTTETELKLVPDALRGAISDRTKALILNSPSNPTGILYTIDELQGIASICAERGIWIISDEIYEYLTYVEGGHRSIVNADNRVRSHTIIVNGLSKGFAMTGWRLGWAAGPKEVITKMTQLASQQTTSPASFAQEAGIAALSGPRDAVREMVTAFRTRRDHMHRRLSQLPGVKCHVPQGAFYHFPDMHAVIGKRYKDTTIENDLVLAEVLLTEGHIATVAGTPFGAPGFLRLSFATSLDNIDEGMNRMTRILEEL